MDPTSLFRHRPACSEPGCAETAVYKVGAFWSDGSHHELKNYGLACASHRASQLARGRGNRDGLTLGPGETMGDVRLFLLDPHRRDSELESVADAPPPPAG
jgi:hypothetical protein